MINLVEARQRLETEFQKHSCPKTYEDSPLTPVFKELVDHASELGPQEIDRAFADSKGRRCVRIQKAISRIGDGTYGSCAECGEDISEKRLQADPAVETCITCCEKLERIQQRTRLRTGTFLTRPAYFDL